MLNLWIVICRLPKDGGVDRRGDFLHDEALNTHCWFGVSRGVIRGQARKIKKRERERERERNAECEKCQPSREYLALATPEQCRTSVFFVFVFTVKVAISGKKYETTKQTHNTNEVLKITNEPMT